MGSEEEGVPGRYTKPLERVDRLLDVATEASGPGTQRELRQEAWASWPWW